MRRILPAIGLAVIAFFHLATSSCAEEPKKLSEKEVKQLLAKNPKLFFLDVREPKEIETLGTMRGYVNIPISQLEGRLSEIPKSALIVTA